MNSKLHSGLEKAILGHDESKSENFFQPVEACTTPRLPLHASSSVFSRSILGKSRQNTPELGIIESVGKASSL